MKTQLFCTFVPESLCFSINLLEFVPWTCSRPLRLRNSHPVTEKAPPLSVLLQTGSGLSLSRTGAALSLLQRESSQRAVSLLLSYTESSLSLSFRQRELSLSLSLVQTERALAFFLGERERALSLSSLALSFRATCIVPSTCRASLMQYVNTADAAEMEEERGRASPTRIAT